MPIGINPTTSGAHRLACRALYRKLLTACTEFQSETASSSKLPLYLQSLVRYRFQYDRNLQSPKRIVNAILFGRKALQLLSDASTGSSEALMELNKVLTSAEQQFTLIHEAKEHMSKDLGHYPAKALRNQAFRKDAADPVKHAANPNAIPILSRPVPLSEIKGGKRFVPHFTVTQGIAFLQYGTTQPHSLSLYIRGEMERNAKRWKHKQDMENMVQLALDEDEWDREMQEKFDVPNEDVRLCAEGTWSKAYRDAESAVYSKIKSKDSALSARAKQLWDITLSEREMAEQERKTVKQERKKAKQKQSLIVDDTAINDSFLGE